MNHDEANELLAALALDAVSAEERAALEGHLVECPRCQSEFDALREVAGAMGNTVDPLPEGLWSKISDRLYSDGVEPVPALAPVATSAGARRPTALARIGSRRLVPRFTIPLGLAAALVAVLAFQLVSADNRITNLQGAQGSNEVTAALRTPGHRVIELRSGTHQPLAKFVVLRDGRGYLVNSQLPALSPSETYQLWGIVSGRAISIGLMGRTPRNVTFTISGSPGPSTLAVTAEPSGGVIKPTLPIVASGPV